MKIRDKELNWRWHGRRSGRTLTAARKRLVESLLPKLRIESTGVSNDISALFSYPVRDVWMEIGFGAGEHLVGQANAHPDIGFLGCEPYVNGVASLLSLIKSNGAKNIRVFDDDVRELIPSLPTACLGRLYILYSDPWPKTRHHRRRITTERNLDAFARVLRPGAEFRFATDQTEFAQWTLERLCRDRRFTWLARRAVDWRKPPLDWVQTRYDQKALSRGLKPVYLNFQRTDLSC